MSNPGDLDTTFGTGGLVVTNIQGYYARGKVAIQSDGKIVLGGTQLMLGVFCLFRFNVDGSLDTSFGSNGFVTTNFDNEVEGHSIIIQSDGKIILGGSYYDNDDYNFALARYNSNGSLDATFGSNGLVYSTYTNNYNKSIAIQSDGKIIMGGNISDAGSDFALARYNSNGSLDTTFGTNGYVQTDFSNDYDYGNSLAIQNDGKIILGGYAGDGMGNNNFAIARYNINGSLDTTFGTGGKINTVFAGSSNSEGNSIAIQNDNKIILGGTTLISGYPWDGNTDFAVARYNADGTLDTSFGTGGLVSTDFFNNLDNGHSLVIQSNGKIILGGYATQNGTRKFALARYTINGSLDTSFGSDNTGKVITSFLGRNDSRGNSLVIQSDGKIILCGDSDYKFALARYIGDSNVPVVPICFPAGTPIVTDQGTTAIENINITKNTIRGKKIVAITKTTTIEDKIVCIEKDSFGPNIPFQKTLISRNHKLLYNKQMIKAKQLVGKVDGVYNKKYNGEILYNVLLETHDKMIVNNLIVETLDPENIVAKLYNCSYTDEEKNNIIVNINQCANDYKKVYGKLK